MTLTVLLAFTPAVCADTVYIRDILYVPLRGGQSSEHRILHRAIRSGTKLERLETNDDTGYSRIRMDDGLEGWLQSQYLVDEPIARNRLDSVQRKLSVLTGSHQQSLIELAELKSKELGIAESNVKLQNKADALTEELDRITKLASNAISIDEENNQLREEHDYLLSEIDALSVANQSFQDTSDQQWFLRGAATILIGLLFGFWVSRKIYHKRTSTGWS